MLPSPEVMLIFPATSVVLLVTGTLLVSILRIGSVACEDVGAKLAFDKDTVTLNGAVRVCEPDTASSVAAVVCVFAFVAEVAGNEAASAFPAAVKRMLPEAPACSIRVEGDAVTPIGRPIIDTAIGVGLAPEVCTVIVCEEFGYSVRELTEVLTVNAVACAMAWLAQIDEKHTTSTATKRRRGLDKGASRLEK